MTGGQKGTFAGHLGVASMGHPMLSTAKLTHYRMASAEGSLGFRDLPAATGDSCGLLTTFLGDFVEGAPVAIEHDRLARILLVSAADAIRIPWVDLH